VNFTVHGDWHSAVMVRALDLRISIKRLRVQLPTVPLSCNDCQQVVHIHVPLLPSSIIWYWPRGSDVVRLRSLTVIVTESTGSLPFGLLPSHLRADCLVSSTVPTLVGLPLPFGSKSWSFGSWSP